MEVDNHYGSMLYAELCLQQNTTLTYVEGMVEVTRETDLKWASHIHKKALDKDNVEQDVLIVSAQFYPTS